MPFTSTARTRAKTLLVALAATTVPAAVAHAQLVVGVDDRTIPVKLYDFNTNTYTDLFSGVEAWGLAADEANRRLFVGSGSQLFSVSYDTLTPQLIGNFSIGGVGFAPTGLAYNPLNNKLYGYRNISTTGIYEIDVATGASTLAFGISSAVADFGGIDFDATTGLFYGVSDVAGGAGRGIYQIDVSSQTLTKIADAPLGETDIDGLAVGGGKAYLITDGPATTQPNFYVYNLATNAYEAPLPSPWPTSEIFAAGAWAPGLVSANVIPEPATLALVGAGLLPLLGAIRRRRR